jgi:15-cis-phytoene synthase
VDLYTKTSYLLSQQLTDAYSTSFGWSIRLFPKDSRRHVYALYGLVRLADEIVDTYRGTDAEAQLAAFEAETYRALEHGYSTNPIIHAFAMTARQYLIERELIDPFFASMRADLAPAHAYAEHEYTAYIHGSAEVIGLMMMKLFVDDAEYQKLSEGARRLGAAYQKINFLRDIKADHAIDRWYFPGSTYDTFDDAAKQVVMNDIKDDLAIAAPAIDQLPRSARAAVALSYRYYNELLRRIDATAAATLKQRRVRIPDAQKLFIMLRGGKSRA